MALPLLLKRQFLFSFLIMALASGCVSGRVRINDAVSVSSDKLLLSADTASGSGLYYFKGAGLESPADISWPLTESSIQVLYKEKNRYVAITENKGIFIISEKGSVQIPVEKNALPDYRIRGLNFVSSDKDLRFFVTYYTPAGVGVTDCRITEKGQYSCTTYNTKNSALKSDFVHQVVADIRGNIWFRYSEAVASGVTKMTPDGKMKLYDRSNSNIGDNTVIMIRAEEKGMGLKGDNVWFVTQGGISKLSYEGEKETWFFYGDKQTFSNKFIKALGVQHWFTDAIIDITDIMIMPDAVFIANKYALFRFTEDNVERFLPEQTGGIEENRIDRIFPMDKNIFTMVTSHREPKPVIRHLLIFQSDIKEWKEVRYWQLKKAFAGDISILPFDADRFFVLLHYPDGETKAAWLSLKDFSIMEIMLKPEEKK